MSLMKTRCEMGVPVEMGTSRETCLMAALESVIWYMPGFALPNCRDSDDRAEVSRAVKWLAEKWG